MTRPPFSGVGTLIPDLGNEGRLTIPRGVSQFVPWYEHDTSQTCLAVAAPQGGLAVFSPLEYEKWRRIEGRLPEGSLGPAGLYTPQARLAQALRGHGEVTLQKNGRFRPPQFARDFELLPSSPEEPIALLAYSGVLHFWIPRELQKYMRELMQEWGELSSPYIQEEDEEEG